MSETASQSVSTNGGTPGARATHQTVRLARGKHRSPEHGTCVMELASMLAGETFTDHPRCACPVIGALLRSYNDWVDEGRRQDLYAYAARVVDSRASHQVQAARANRLIEWAEELEERRLKRSFFGSARWVNSLDPHPADIASRVVCAITRQKTHPHLELLAIIDELLEMGRTPKRQPGWFNGRAHDGTPLDDYLYRLIAASPTTSPITAPSRAPATTSPG